MSEPAVLVVDDELGIIRLCRRLLEKAGFNVMTSSDPREGMTILEQKPVSLLLVDIRMPGMDGFQLIEMARKHQPDLAVVIMTGYGTVETAIEALRRGADGLVLKPFSGIELVESVRRALLDNQKKQDALRLQTLRPLFAITESLFTETNPQHLQELLLEAVCGNLRCSIAGIYRRNDHEDCYRLVAGRGDLPIEESVQEDLSLLASAENWNTVVRTNRQGPGEASLQASLEQHGWESTLSAPLTVGEVKGVLFTARSKEEGVFRASDQEIFAILARQAVIALENARLHAELRAYIRQVEESQRALIQAEKITIAGRLTASIAHEINNPLQAVQNCLHLAGRVELDSKIRQDYLTMAQNEMDRLMHTVQRMLDYYRPGALDRKPVDVEELINRVVALAQKQLSDHGITMQLELNTPSISIMAVGDQVQQVLLNLILNAMEAMPGGGDLLINTGVSSGHIEILIEDSGPGVPDDQKERIFEPFVSTKETGTGLGLAVSYGIVSAHGGTLELVEGRGRGACFRISLPAGEAT